MYFFGLVLILGLANAFTTDIAGGKMECFTEKLSQGAHMAIYYQVIEGGNSDINFIIYNPNGGIFFEEKRQSSGMVDKDAPMDGNYKMCLDNSFSGFSATKTVALYMDFSSNDGLADEEQANKVEKLSTELTHLLTHARIEVVMLQIRNQMHQQSLNDLIEQPTNL